MNLEAKERQIAKLGLPWSGLAQSFRAARDQQIENTQDRMAITNLRQSFANTNASITRTYSTRSLSWHQSSPLPKHPAPSHLPLRWSATLQQ